MAISMYSASVPVCLRMLGNLSVFLDKAEAFCTAKKIDPSVLLGARLAPDMLPLSKQIHIACDASKFAVSRIVGIEAPKFDDSETSIAEFKARIAATAAFLKTITPDQINGTEEKEVQVPIRGTPVTFKAEAYLKHFAMANMWFHVTTAYNILRHNGVELGKMDFLGSPSQSA
jgi:uncharacterized protein